MIDADPEDEIKVRYVAGCGYNLAKTKYVSLSLGGIIPSAVKTAGRHCFGARVFCLNTPVAPTLFKVNAWMYF